jgi:hypothetical protein
MRFVKDILNFTIKPLHQKEIIQLWAELNNVNNITFLDPLIKKDSYWKPGKFMRILYEAIIEEGIKS